MEKQIILLNGPSSSGKSTIARILRTLISEKRGERYDVVSIDDFLHMTAEDVIYEDDVFEISHVLCGAVLNTVRSGEGVIVDHVITSERIFDQLSDAFRPFELRMIRVTCPLDVLREREKARGDRCPGSAEASDTYIFPRDGYDLTVDTGSMTASECAGRIFEQCFKKAETDI